MAIASMIFDLIISNWPYIMLVGVIIYCLHLVIYRLLLSPVAGFPGPKLAGLTFWYEFYFDVIKRGSYFRQIEKLHCQYGPIIRINPYELHVNDPAFYPILYTGPKKRRDKWPWASRMFGNSTSAFGTTSHHLHRVRRSALNPMFSRSAVQRVAVPIIHAALEVLCERLDNVCDKGDVIDMGLVFTVLAADVISAYAFGDSFGLLAHPNFAPDWVAMVQAPSELGHFVKQFPYLLPILRLFPKTLVSFIAPATAMLFQHQDHNTNRLQQLINNRQQDSVHVSDQQSCVFDALLKSNLPASEKHLPRLAGEAQILVGAGTLTTGNVLKTLLFHLLDNPDYISRLQKELEQVQRNRNDMNRPRFHLHDLQALPFLAACIQEGLRLAYGVTHRLQLISPDEDLPFRQWRIPAGTPVSMTSVFMHDDVNIFPEPRAFRPERWLRIDDSDRLSRHFVPFSKGTRMCLGMNLAYAELNLVLAAVLSRYELVLVGVTREDIEMKHDFFDPSPKLDSKGLRVKLRRRNYNGKETGELPGLQVKVLKRRKVNGNIVY